MRVRDPSRVERIIETAAQLFGEFGYNDVRMEDIANRAGVAKGTLYLYFKDKDDLFLELILKRMTHLYERAQQFASEAAPAETRLTNVVRDVFDYFRSQPHIFMAIQRLDHSGTNEQVEALRASRNRFLNLTSSIIDELLDNLPSPAADSQIAARLLCGMMREILFSSAEGHHVMPEQIVQILLRGVIRNGSNS